MKKKTILHITITEEAFPEGLVMCWQLQVLQ